MAPRQDDLAVRAVRKGDDIVLVITASAHRQAAFEANEFLMDWLKTKAPFWKLEEHGDETAVRTGWVEAREADDAAAARWQTTGARASKPS